MMDVPPSSLGSSPLPKDAGARSHEDLLMSPEEGVRKSVDLLRRVMVNQTPRAH